MLLQEIFLTEEQKLINECFDSFQDLNALHEGLGDGLMDLVKTMKSISASNGKKSELNDKVIGNSLTSATQEFKQIYDNTSSKAVKWMYDKIMSKLGVSFGMNISRSDNVKKLCAFKFLIAIGKTFKFVLQKLWSDNVTEQALTTLVGIFLPLLLPVVSAIFLAQNIFELLKAIVLAGSVMKKFYAKADEARRKDSRTPPQNN